MKEHSEDDQERVAIVGMAGRFPGAQDLDELWRNLRDGVDAVRDLTTEDLLASGVDPAVFNRQDYVKAAAPVDGAELFDASFFGFSPREAELLDPQVRVFMECAWEALESAGYSSEAYDGWIGLFAGVSLPAYLRCNLLPHRELAAQVGNFQLMLANDRDYFATRVSYKLGLEGPSVNVQTACSTSLVATHLACQSLLSYDCSLALAGGIRIRFPQLAGYICQEGSIFSPDGRCRAFDARGRGALFGEGAGVVVLKRLSEAIADGDTIHAVIRGSACNNDGPRKVGYTAPGVDGQAKVIALAQAVAGVSAETIGYVEAHGSGTPLGDPIEVAALTRAFRAHTDRKRYCALGSIKTNVGHLEAAAGIAGLLKTVLSLQHATLPPSLHFETPNPEIDFENGPFHVNTAAREWPRDGVPRRAGVSSFGMGGTNAHVVLEEAPAVASGSASRPWQLLLLSAKTGTALATSSARLAAFLQRHPETDFADVVHTLQAGRRTFDHRLALVCRDRQDALTVLAGADPQRLLRSEQESSDRPVTFLFSGLGEHYPGMARDLYATEPTFRTVLDECCDLLAPHLGLDLRGLLFPPVAPSASAVLRPDLRVLLGRGEQRCQSELDRTLYAQPAVFAVEYALAKLLMEWGIRPQSLIGYSVGEYVAACVAGVLSLPDAMALVARRARLIDGLPAGAMLAVPLAEEDVPPLLDGRLSIAALNGPCLSVLSGPESAIAEVERRLAGQGTPTRRLPTTHAFHSQMMEPIRDTFARMVGEATLHPPEIPYLSNVTGTWITAAEATDPGYWVRHLCQAVRFADGLAELSREPERVLLEVGPGQGLTALAIQAPGELVAIPTLRSSWDPQPDTSFLITALAKLWLAGLRVDWGGFYAHERRRRVPLPTYPFERQRYFIDPPSRQEDARVTLAEPAERAERPQAMARHARPAHLRIAYVAPATDLERRLVQVWQEVLGIDEIGVHDSFFELGGHSLLAPQLLVQLRKHLGIDFPMRDLAEAATVARMASAVELIQREGLAALAARREEVDLWAEASHLDPTVAPETSWSGAIGEPAEIFLTGGTGFLGSHILAELLRRTRARIHCLVRGADAEAAGTRLRSALVNRELWHDGMAGRIAVVPGDLGEPRFGLCAEAFRELAGRVDLIYHCGAWVNFNYPYKLLKPANVLGTVEALRLAALGRAKPLHFISSIAATPEGDYGFRAHPVVYEDEDSDSIEGLFGGYGETKWVCERLIRIARSRGLPVTIYRPGVLSGHSQTGIGNTRDMVWSVIKSCIQMGVHPSDEHRLGVTPVDYVASAIVHLSLDARNTDRLFQLPHPHPPTNQQVYAVVRSYGYPLEPIPFREWVERVMELARVDSGNALSPFVGVAENYDKVAEKAKTEGEDGRLKEIVFDGTNTQAGLAGSGIVCPDLDEELIARYLDAFVRSGFYPPPPTEPSRAWQVLVLSAPAEAALEKETAGLAEYLRRRPEADLGDVAYTLQTGRCALTHRRMLVCRDVDDALSVLEGGAAGRLETYAGSEGQQRVSFLLPGVGDHHSDMALGLYRGEPTFRRIVDDCCDRLLPELGFDLRDELFPGLADGGGAAPAAASFKRDLWRLLQADGRGTVSGRLTRMATVHPAVFVVEYALAKLLMGWGIRPQAMIGYSLGEYTAACLAGVISLEDCLTLVARRARWVEELPAGAMLAVPLTGEEIEPLLRDGLGVAVINGPALHVVSGPLASVEALEAELAARGVLCRRLSADQAGHSPMMEPIAGRLRELLAGCELRLPEIPYISNVTGTWIRPEEAADPDYWVRHLCGRVLFSDGLGRLLEIDSVLLEVGPGQSLTAFAKQHPARDPERAGLMFSTLRSAFNVQSDRTFLLGTLGRLWMAGVPIDWAATHTGRRRLLPLPDQPGERSAPAIDRSRIHVWPNGMRIVYQKLTEAEHFYNDIFEREIYRRHGIELRDGDCVFDVGANIGAFMLYAHQVCRGAQIYSFEPAPPLFEKLRLNAALNQVEARLFNCGLSDHAGMARFTFYPHSSGMSSFHADKEQEKEVLRLMMRKEREAGVEGVDELMGCADDFLEERFRSEAFECRLRTLSDVIEDCGVEWIDLLKIDVQKAELAVLKGIREEHWPIIGQIVMEVHDLDCRLERIVGLLAKRGFRVTVEQDELLRGSVLYNLFAIGTGAGPQEDARERQRHAYQRQTEPASPTRPVFGVQYAAPGSELERSIAEVLQRVLQVENLGIDDNFFDVGGTSLTGLQAVRELNHRLGAELSPVAIFETPTVRTMARSLQSAAVETAVLRP